MKRIYLATLCVLSGLALVLSGCRNGGLAVNMVEGTVRWNDQPVAGALVTFQPQGESAVLAVGTTDERGHYQLTAAGGDYGKGTVAGRYKVVVTKIPSGARSRPAKTTELPGVYAEAATTPLEAEVLQGKNTFDFTLEGAAAAAPKPVQPKN